MKSPVRISCLLAAAVFAGAGSAVAADASAGNDHGSNWSAYGRTADEQHYSPVERCEVIPR